MEQITFGSHLDSCDFWISHNAGRRAEIKRTLDYKARVERAMVKLGKDRSSAFHPSMVDGPAPQREQVA